MNIFKIVCNNYENGERELMPNIFFDEAKAIEFAKQLEAEDEDDDMYVSIYEETPDQRLGRFRTIRAIIDF